MNHLGFILAVAKGKVKVVLEAIPLCTLIESPEGGLSVLRAEKNGIKVDTALWLLATTVTLPWESSGTDGDWTLLHCMPMLTPDVWKWGAKVFRHLRTVALDYPTHLHGPWSCLRIKREWPAKWAALFPNSCVPHTITGSDPFADHEVDYDPTDQDCIDDVEPASVPGL